MILKKKTAGTLTLMLAMTCMAQEFNSAIHCRIELDRHILSPSSEKQEGVIKITLDTPPPLPVATHARINLALVIDQSASMKGDSLEQAKYAAIDMLRNLDETDLFSLVAYNERIQTIIPAQQAIASEELLQRIRDIQPSGETGLFGGISQGAAELRKNLFPNSVNRIVLLSDGLANVGPSHSSDLKRLATGLAKEGITVSTIGLGESYSEDLMTGLASASDGNTYIAHRSGDLAAAFKKELHKILSVAALQTVIDIQLGEKVRIRRILGDRSQILGKNHAEVKYNQLYSGQSRYTLIEVELPPGKMGDEIELAKVFYNYTDPKNGQIRRGSYKQKIRYQDREKSKPVQTFNSAVGNALILNRIQEVNAQAIKLMDAKRNDEAAALLLRQNYLLEQQVKDYPPMPPELDQQIRDMAANAREFESRGMSNVKRKNLRTTQIQVFNQQILLQDPPAAQTKIIKASAAEE